MQPKSAITYLRVSTQRQGASGLGIEAQRAAVETFCRDRGYRVVGEIVEIESGRHSARPGLRDGPDRAKASRALLVIASLKTKHD
jgi:DNA invertase Pin-like site-specific DNA recombinase